MKRMRASLFALLCVTLLFGGCAGTAENAAPLVVSEAFDVPTPQAAPEPTPEPTPDVRLTEYRLGGAVLTLPEGLEAEASSDGSFFITGSTMLVNGSWYDADYFAYLGAEYPSSADEAVSVLLPEGREILSVSPSGDGTVVEYIEEGETTRWATYAVFTRGETLCWKVEFICPESIYDELRPSFEAWAGEMSLPDDVERSGTRRMTSSTGLFTLELPGSCIALDESVTADVLALYGLDEADAQQLLDEVESRTDVQDVIYRADFGAVLTVTVDPDAGMTQAQMLEREDEMGIDEALGGEDASYEGVVLVGDNPNAFYFVRVARSGYDELGFTTYHDETGASITFSFAGFTEEEAQEILQTLEMVARTD